MWVASLLRYILHGTPSFEHERIEGSTVLLFQDLERQGLEGVTLRRNAPIRISRTGSPVAPILVSKR